jgi:hypothetical protein
MLAARRRRHKRSVRKWPIAIDKLLHARKAVSVPRTFHIQHNQSGMVDPASPVTPGPLAFPPDCDPNVPRRAFND